MENKKEKRFGRKRRVIGLVERSNNFLCLRCLSLIVVGLGVWWTEPVEGEKKGSYYFNYT